MLQDLDCSFTLAYQLAYLCNLESLAESQQEHPLLVGRELADCGPQLPSSLTFLQFR